MKKIVHVIDNLTLGGAETLLYTTIKKLPFFEHHVVILTDKIQIEGIKDLATIHCLHHAGWLSLIRTCRRMQTLVKKLEPELVHSHLFLSSFITRLALGTRYRIVYSIHNLYSATIFTQPHLKWMEKLIYNPQHEVIAVSRYVLEDYKKVVRKCKGGHVLYNFIDDRFIDDPGNENVRALSLKKWVAVGSLKPQKNLERLISLFADLYHQAADKEGLYLDIYGEGKQRPKLEQLIGQKSVPVNLKGNRKNIVDILGGYDAYISSSSYEGYGIAPMEAMAKGLPLFLSDIPVYKEIYGEHAFYFPAGGTGSTEFLDACQIYSNMNAEERQLRLAAGARYAKATANSEKYINELLGIYRFR